MNVAIVGGGIIGIASAYFLAKKGVEVTLFEADPSYQNSSFNRSCGGFRHQFATKENVLLGQFGGDFISNAQDILKTNEDIELPFNVNGYLLLFGNYSIAEKAIKTNEKCGFPLVVLEGKEIQETFPWINLDGVSVATLSNNYFEGWTDPYLLHALFKNKCKELGVNFVTKIITDINGLDSSLENFDKVLVTAGCWTNQLINLPVKAHKHTVFTIDCSKFIEHMPLVADFSTGVYWRPEGTGYIAGSPIGRFNQTDLEPDWNDFDEYVWPGLAKRSSIFEAVKMTGGWAGYYDTNTFDNNAIVGKYSEDVYVATGFTGRGVMQAPGIGRALTELITTDRYQTIDLTAFSPDRIFKKQRKYEPYVI
tara:strand:- start:6309 stop:7403 length:1095 start_codon:yes stop_codon:yes gene_type:complete